MEMNLWGSVFRIHGKCEGYVKYKETCRIGFESLMVLDEL
jgi:hypothetical protein